MLFHKMNSYLLHIVLCLYFFCFLFISNIYLYQDMYRLNNSIHKIKHALAMKRGMQRPENKACEGPIVLCYHYVGVHPHIPKLELKYQSCFKPGAGTLGFLKLLFVQEVGMHICVMKNYSHEMKPE